MRKNERAAPLQHPHPRSSRCSGLVPNPSVTLHDTPKLEGTIFQAWSKRDVRHNGRYLRQARVLRVFAGLQYMLKEQENDMNINIDDRLRS